MSVVAFAVVIVAAFFAGALFFLMGRLGADSWLALAVALVVYGWCVAAGPALWHH